MFKHSIKEMIYTKRFFLCKMGNWPRATRDGKRRSTGLPVPLKVMDKCLETSVLKEVKS
ncbi:hypothetical protein E2C01_046537 [Portunus trituberculatus]|uniref:Uncharacterized protein n=1 Tax=Portunus trituberculatus TaxID=210409 RepID=A0A5B7FYV3_PORTR|nr:hypothetical protein [Portunus trituberculatus]